MLRVRLLDYQKLNTVQYNDERQDGAWLAVFNGKELMFLERVPFYDMRQTFHKFGRKSHSKEYYYKEDVPFQHTTTVNQWFVTEDDWVECKKVLNRKQLLFKSHLK